MTVEELLLRLEEALKTETEKRKQQEIIEVINKIKNESLYNAAIYDFLTLRFETKLTYKEAYEIPAIRQAFLDSIKNPSLRSTKSNIFLDIVDLFTNKLDVEILKNDEEFNQIIKDITYEQAERLLGGDEVDKIFEDEKYYNLLIKKAEEDNRFYKILPYSSLSINDGTCKLISQHNKGNNKLVKLPGEIQLAILKQIDETSDLSNFLTNFSRYDDEVKDYVLSSPNFGEQLILAQAKNDYGDAIISAKYEENIISKYLDFIKELSFKQKYNFIYKMQNPEMQKYIIEKLNFVKNLISQKDYGNFFEGIKDKSFAVDCICDKDILEGINNIHLRKLTTKLNHDEQVKLFNHPVFQEYLKTLNYELIGVIALFDQDIIDEILPKLKKVTIYDLMNIFKETKNHKYIKDVIESIDEAIAEQEENLYQNLRSFMTLTVYMSDNLKELTPEEFDYFYNLYKPAEDVESAASFFDRITVHEPLTPAEQEIYNQIDFNQELTEEQKTVLAKHRTYMIFTKELRTSLDFLFQKEDRVVKHFGYNILNYMTEEEQKKFLDRTTIDCLMNNLASCEIVTNYCYELYLENPNIFDEVKNETTRYVAHSEENLSEEALQKLRTLFAKANSKTRVNLLKGTLVEDSVISQMLKEEILSNPNIYSGELYRSKFDKILSSEEMEKVLRQLSLNNLLKYYSEFSFNDKQEDIGNKILLERKEEILHELNNVTYNFFSGIFPDRIINRMLNNVKDKMELMKTLNPNLLITLYSTDTLVDKTETNNMIVSIITENPNMLLETPKDETKKLLNNIKVSELTLLIEKLNINEVIALFAKTQNKLLEEKLMQEFDKQPYFINNSELAVEEILNRLEENNKNKIYTTIDEQFNALDLPYNIKDKLRKSSYDEKIFLIYGVKENIFNDEKYQLINELLKTDPFALNSLNIKLLEDDIFNISKNIIPKIYRYESLTISYINILKTNNKKSKIMLLLIEYLNKTTLNIEVYTKKLDTIIKYLTNINDQNIERIDLNNITIEELQELEEYILIDSTGYLIESSSMAFFGLDNERKQNIVGSSFTEIEKKRTRELDEQILKETDLDKAKDIFFKRYYKISLEQVDILIRKYAQSLDTIKKDISNQTLVELFEEIKYLRNISTIEEIQKQYKECPIKHNVSEYIYMFEEFDKAYSQNIADNIKGYKNGQNTTIKIDVDGEQKEVPVIELEKDFELIIHSTDAYGSMDMINDNYFDSWNYSDKTSNHGICTCFISNANLGAAPVAGKGVILGFTNLNEKSITSMAPYDLVSRNEGIITTSRHPAMFTDTKSLVDYTRHTHNEIVLERRNISSDSKFPVVQPDCIVIYEEMTPELKENALVAQEHFKQQGIELPIIYINRTKVITIEARRVIEMLNIYDQNPSIELLSEIINKYESNRCGLDHDKNINVEELFEKDRIYQTILKTIEHLKSIDDKDNIIKLIIALEKENYKFKMVNDNVGERAHTFDLLDEKLTQELEELKITYGANQDAINSNFRI